MTNILQGLETSVSTTGNKYKFQEYILPIYFTDEIWKLTRTPHLKDTDAAQLDQAVANYTLQNTVFYTFNNTEDTCRLGNNGHQLDTSSLVLTSAAALALFRRMY